ncbi:phage/plasmid replication domain-containing protein [Planococcus halocryophilus]|uniref:phage/plasmid replication domain-containing protein n=1 Tax=Planococcus halocryophilus TaxID=1215089 RepID=UPI001F0D93EA|nr:phage/plasmid replication protein [Planococcus halocryophilus]MCH4825553.1 hypothetical protein [Planococcus halocryophilus]
MFDTVRLKSENIAISKETFTNIENLKTITYFNNETGELNDTYQIKTKNIPYITYITNTRLLIIQVSIPKFLFGENVNVIKLKDINVFWDKLQQELHSLLGVEISKTEWIVQRIDICWNFYVGNKVNDYIQFLGKKQLPYKQTYLINHSETVIYKNKSSSIMFYDKQKECKAKKQSAELIEKTFGILRMEIRPPLNSIKKYSSERQAVQILTFEFFKLNFEKVMGDISFEESQSQIVSCDWLEGQKINRIETVLGFNIIRESLGITKTKELYGSTYYARNKWIQELHLPKENLLPNLLIEWKELQEN